MAEPDIKIKIATTADTAGIKQTDAALDKLEATAGKTGRKTQELAEGQKKVGDASKGSSRALLTFSQGLEDAQYGVKGVLNNIPGLVIALGGTAGLAGAISIAAVSLSVLGDFFSKTDKKVGDSKDKIKSWADEARTVYQELADLGREDEERRAKEVAGNTKTALEAIKSQASAENGAGKVETAAAKAQNLLALAQQRYALLELESALAVSTGTKLLELAKQREQSVRNIYLTELETAEIPRRAALADAENKVRASRGAETVTAGAAGDARTAALAAKLAKEALENEASQRIADRIALIEQLAEMKKVLAKLVGEDSLSTGGSLASAATPSPETQAKLKEQNELRKANTANDSKIQQLILQADAEKGRVETLAEAARVAAEAQKQAADAMAEASQTLQNLRETGGIERQSDRALKAEDLRRDALQSGADVTSAITEAIRQIQAGAAAQGQPLNPVETEAIGRLQGLAKDATPDAKQGGQLAGILQGLANSLDAKDKTLAASLQTLITQAKTQQGLYEGLQKQINDLGAKVSQKP